MTVTTEYDEEHLELVPKAILETRERKLRTRAVREFLVKWKDLLEEDAAWEGEQVLQHPMLKLLEDKQILAGGIVISPIF